jgi:polyhydroxyalkanoate synthase subunit PhaC
MSTAPSSAGATNGAGPAAAAFAGMGAGLDGGMAAQITATVDRMIQRNIKGLGYFASPAPAVGSSPRDQIHARGTMQLYHYRSMADEIYRVPILVVMATTNRGYILDLAPGQSFVEYLLRCGYDVYMIDWEAPRPDERHLNLDTYVNDFIPDCLARVQADTGIADVTLMGYCMGGVLATLYSASHNDSPVTNLVVFTTPINMTKMGLFSAWSDQRWFDVDRLVDSLGNVPSEMLYTSFDMLRPASRLAANVRLWDNMWNDDFVKSYRMLERWSNDMLPLAGEYFRDTTKKLMWDNALVEDRLDIGGRPVRLGTITMPFLHVVAEHDHIVTHDASSPLVNLVGSTDKQEVSLKGGHVSLLAGANAQKRLWPRLDQWLQERST